MQNGHYSVPSGSPLADAIPLEQGSPTFTDSQALVDVPLSFDLESAQHPPEGKAGGSALEYTGTLPTGRWQHAACHTVTAVVGAGVLALPYALSFLGWAGGVTLLAVAAAVSLYSSYLLAALHEEPDGTRHNRYRDLGQAVLGPKLGLLAVLPFQFAVLVGMGVAYTVTAGQSLQAVHNLRCQTFDTSGIYLSGQTIGGCGVSISVWIVLFGVLQLALSQVPDFHSLWWVSLTGAVMSAFYATVAALAAAANVQPGVSYGERPGSQAERVFGALNSLGSITFAYGGHSVLLEIQATLATPPPAVQTMMRGVFAAYGVALAAYFPVSILGYLAYGNAVNADVLLSIGRPRWLIAVANFAVFIHVAASYQVFTQPVFENVEALVRQRWHWLHERPLVMRLVGRTLYVCLTTFVAVALPFFADLMGIIGAIGFTPCTFILPSVLWLVARKCRPWELWLNWTIIGCFTCMAVLATIGSSRQLAVHAHEYHVFS